MSEIVNPSRIDHDARHHALVEHMVGELRPVRRLWPVKVRLALWIALEAGVLLLAIRNSHRTDLPQQFRNPWFLFDVAGFAVAGAIGTALALRSAIPGREPRRREEGLLLVLTVASVLLLLHEPINAIVPVGSFIREGLPCACGIAMFASLPLLALFWAVKRGAPLAAGTGGALVGAGAFLFSFALMRVFCPIDECLHLFMWHFLPALAGIGLSACVGVVLLRRRAPR